MGTRDIRQRFADYHAFFTLAYALIRHRGSEAEELRVVLNMLGDFLRTATGKELRESKTTLEELLSQALVKHQRVLPRKKSARAISQDFRQLLQVEQDIWRFGIPHHWLAHRFDLTSLRQAEDLPPHARFGIGIHAGSVSVEEATLLGDAFFLLVRAQDTHEQMLRAARRSKLNANRRGEADEYRSLSALNAAVCTYARLGVLTTTAFVEALVNSVGWTEAVTNASLSDADREQLRGTKKGRFLALEAKLERFPRIIRADGTTPIVLSDEKQMREPFISFLRGTKQVRDASMHYAPGKAPITLPPQEWLALVEDALKRAVDVAREFWSACYPQRGQPRYLAELHYEGLVRYARDRLRFASAGNTSPTSDLST